MALENSHITAPRIIYRVVILIAIVPAVLIARHYSGWVLAIPLLWSGAICVCMHRGIDTAPLEARVIEKPQTLTLKIKLVFLAILFAPIIFPLLLMDALLALLWAWLCIIGFNTADFLYTRFVHCLEKRL